jgi:hypothetical protein
VAVFSGDLGERISREGMEGFLISSLMEGLNVGLSPDLIFP